MHKVLILTYYWPPSGGAGVQRWLKFAKYLPQFGVEPHVVTVDPEWASYPQYDTSLERELGEACKVYRTKSFEINNIYKKVSSTKEVPYGGFANEANPSFFQKAARFIRGNIFVPDARVGWNKYAYKKALEIIQKEQINTVVTTGPPHSTHLIGLKLKKKLKVNWLADFRDPWTDIYYYSKLYHTPIAKKIDKGLQNSVFQNADILLTVSGGFMDLFKAHEPTLQEKGIVISNGFDEADFDNTSAQEHSGPFRLTYVGSISPQYPISALLKAIEKLPANLSRNLVLQFVGSTEDQISDLLSTYTVNCSVKAFGYLPHKEALKISSQSNALLLIVPDIINNVGIVPGKLFEYLGSGKPILALGPNNADVGSIVHKAKGGFFCDYNNPQKVLELLQQLMTSKAMVADSREVEKYKRKALAEELSKIFLTFKH